MAEMALFDLDVLQQGNGAPNPEGMQLWRGLDTVMNLGLVVPDGVDGLRVKVWLQDMRLEVPPYLFEGEDGSLERVRAHLRLPVTLRVTLDPELAAQAVRHGIVALLIGHPSFTRPEFMPDYERPVKSWDVLTAEVQHQRSLLPRAVLDDEPSSA